MLTFALKSAFTLALLYSGFLALLSRETFHRLNRLLLLFCLTAALVVPLVHITVERPMPLETYEVQALLPEGHMAGDTSTLSVSEKGHTEAAPITITHGTDWTDLPNHIYNIGLFLMLASLLIRTLMLRRLMKGGLRHTDSRGDTVILKNGDIPPFSIFRWIVMSVSDYERHRQAILTHEQEHIRLRHTLDLLLLTVVQVIQWFNPLVWLLGRDLRAVHEYEADEAVINQGIDAKQYQQLLVMKAVGNRLQPFANNLNRGSLKNRITMMQRKKSSRWHTLRALFAIPVTAFAVYAFATPAPVSSTETSSSETTAKPLVEYKANQRWGKKYVDSYRVSLGEGVWVEQNGKSHIEEQYFTYSYNDSRGTLPVMMLNGKVFDHNSLPALTSKDLRKIEVTNDGNRTKVNLITTPVTIPASVRGNVPRVQTILLPGKGNIYITNRQADEGDWMHCSVASWENTSYGYSIRDEFKLSKTKPGFKCYIYAGTETAQRDISRAEALMKELGITNYEIVRNLPVRHFTNAELLQWAQQQKQQGTAFDKLYDAMAPNHMTCEDVHAQWHIVKAVYGRK